METARGSGLGSGSTAGASEAGTEIQPHSSLPVLRSVRQTHFNEGRLVREPAVRWSQTSTGENERVKAGVVSRPCMKFFASC